MNILITDKYKEGLRKSFLAGEASLDRARGELKLEADLALKRPLRSIVDTPGKAASGDVHDYYSEAPYWWPDPKNPSGPFIRRDGEIYPGRFDAHRALMEAMTADFYLLSAAGYLLAKQEYTDRAKEIAAGWFLDEKTRMNPHLDYAQAITGVTKGRGIGIIDTVTLIRFMAGMDFFAEDARMSGTVQALKGWFADYLQWLDTSKNGIAERDYFNNHANWWNAQSAAYAAFVGDEKMLAACAERFKTRILPVQTREDGAFVDELTRTRSLTYCFYNLNAAAATAEILYHAGIDLWHYETGDGKSLQKSLDYMLPYYENPYLWRHEQIAGPSIPPQASFCLAAVRLDAKYGVPTAERAAGRRLFALDNAFGAVMLTEGAV